MYLYLATMSSMYNDYSSLYHDRIETKLNSLDSLEFNVDKTIDHRSNDFPDPEAKLLHLARYEWKCAQDALMQLSSAVEPRVSKALKSFCNANYLFGQLYQVKDNQRFRFSGTEVDRKGSHL